MISNKCSLRCAHLRKEVGDGDDVVHELLRPVLVVRVQREPDEPAGRLIHRTSGQSSTYKAASVVERPNKYIVNLQRCRTLC